MGGASPGGGRAGLPLAGLVPLRLLRPHERVVWSRVLDVLESILGMGAVVRPVVVEARHLVILDGHHRVTALRLLGAVYAPALVVDYERHVAVSSWRPGVRVDRGVVLEAGLSGRLLPPKTSRHRLLVDVDFSPVPLEALLGGGGHVKYPVLAVGGPRRGRGGVPGRLESRVGLGGSGLARRG